MTLFNFSTWDSIQGVRHVFGRSLSLNEQESRSRPEGIDPKELEQIEKMVKLKVNYAIADIIKTHPFFAGAATKLKYVYTYEVGTAAVDGTHMFINPLFFKDMNKKAVQFVIMHEIMHCMLMHFLRMDMRNRRKWNYATDYEINLIVSRELDYDMTQDPILKDGLYDPQYKGMGAELIYNKIPNPEKTEEQGGGQGQGEGQGQEGGGGEEKGKDQGQESGGGKGEGQGQEGGGGEGSPIDEVLTPEEGARIAKKEGIEPGGELKPTKEDWENELKKAAREHAKSKKGGRGAGSSPLDELVNEILTPKIDWKKELKKYIGTARYSEEYRVPSKRYIYKDEIRSGVWASEGAMDNVVFAMDTSGSMTGFISGVFSELSAILKQDKVKGLTAVYFDDGVRSVEKISPDGKPDPKKVTGGGGTSFSPVIEWVNKNVKNADLVIILSDGYNGDSLELSKMKRPKWSRACIWVIIGNPTWEPPFGKVIHIPEEEFQNP